MVADRIIRADMINPKLEMKFKNIFDTLWNGCVIHFGIAFDDLIGI